MIKKSIYLKFLRFLLFNIYLKFIYFKFSRFIDFKGLKLFKFDKDRFLLNVNRKKIS